MATPNADVGSPPSGTAPQPAVVPPRAMATEITDMLTRPQMRRPVDAGGLMQRLWSLGQIGLRFLQCSVHEVLGKIWTTVTEIDHTDHT